MSQGENVKQMMEYQIKNQPLKYPIPSIKFTMAVLLITYVLLFTIIVLNAVMNEGLFIQGLNFIYNYQQSQGQPAIIVIHNLVSLLSYPLGVMAMILIYYFLASRKLKVAVHLVFYFYATYIIAIIVQSQQETRPVWYDLRIQRFEWFCVQTFGSPSGHCYSIVMLLEPIVSDTIGYLKWKILSIPLAAIFIAMVLSRMFLGVHSADEVFYGLLLGFIALVLFKFVYQKELYELFWQFLTGLRSNWKIVGLVGLNIVSIIIPIVFFLYGLNNRPMPQKYIDNLNKQCNINTATSKDTQASMMATGCSIVGLPFGIIYGFILQMNKYRYRMYFLGKWKYVRKWKFILKIILFGVCSGIPYLASTMINSHVIKDSDVGDYLVAMLGAMGVGLGITWTVPILAFKFNVVEVDTKTEAAIPKQSAQHQIQGAV